MKNHTLKFVSGLLALAMLTGCGAAQAETEATSLNQAMLFEQAEQEQESYTFPERFTGDWLAQEGKLTIHADAPIVAEQGVVLPTATVEPRLFEQADVDNLFRVFLKGSPVYENIQTKAELQKELDRIRSAQWNGDPDAPIRTEEEREAHRQQLIAWYEAEIAKAPEEAPIIHGFSDSSRPDGIIGNVAVDGIPYEIMIQRDLEWGSAAIGRKGYRINGYSDQHHPTPTAEDAIAMADAVIEELGYTDFVCDDVQKAENGLLRLYYVPTVNGIRQSSIRQNNYEDYGTINTYFYMDYGASEETNPDTVLWFRESIQFLVGKDGIYCFKWQSPCAQTKIQQTHTALLSFDKIAEIARNMLPVVIVGPKETNLTELDRINGMETRMDVEITKVSLTLMRIRDKGSRLGTIVPVWDFWGTWDWYDADSSGSPKGASYTTQPMLTLNAIDGTVVSRELGY